LETWRIVWCNCEDQLYYYYKGDKRFIYTLLIDDYLIVGFEQQMQDEIVNYINQTGLFKPVDTNKIYHNPTPEYSFLFVNTLIPGTCCELRKIISLLEDNPFIPYANLIFRFSEETMVTFTDEFAVRVHDENDLSDLYNVVQETNTRFKYQNQFMPKWCIMGADKNSNGNTLQMANYFYETGKFSEISYAFMILMDNYPIPKKTLNLKF